MIMCFFVVFLVVLLCVSRGVTPALFDICMTGVGTVRVTTCIDIKSGVPVQ